MDKENNFNQEVNNLDAKPIISELLSMANIVNLETQKNILLATGAIQSEDQFTKNTFEELLTKNIQNQIEKFGKAKVCFFICPKLDLTDMRDISRFFPSKLSVSSVNGNQADIFISRIPRIFQMFENLVKTDSPHRINFTGRG